MGDPGFLRALDELRALHMSKGHDYADATDPLRNYVESAHDAGIEPWRAAWARLSEKYHRLVNLLRKGAEPNHESLDDTFMDLAAMALIVRSLRQRPEVYAPFVQTPDAREPQSVLTATDGLDGATYYRAAQVDGAPV